MGNGFIRYGAGPPVLDLQSSNRVTVFTSRFVLAFHFHLASADAMVSRKYWGVM
jgi:hypothetical protein